MSRGLCERREDCGTEERSDDGPISAELSLRMLTLVPVALVMERPAIRFDCWCKAMATSIPSMVGEEEGWTGDWGWELTRAGWWMWLWKECAWEGEESVGSVDAEDMTMRL